MAEYMILKLKKLNFIDKLQDNLSSFIWILLILFSILNLDILLHSLLTLVHFVFEWIELGLEHLIEHLFHTSRKQSQVIVFYLLLSTGSYLLYYLCRGIPDLYRHYKSRLMAVCLRYKASAWLYWQDQSLIGKLKLIAVGLLCVKLLYFLIFG